MLGFSKFTSLTHLTTEGVWSSRHMSRMVVMEMQFFVMLDTHYYITQGAGTGTQTNQLDVILANDETCYCFSSLQLTVAW